MFFDEQIEILVNEADDAETACRVVGTCNYAGRDHSKRPTYEWDTDVRITRRDTGADVTRKIGARKLDRLLGQLLECALC